MTKNEFLAKLKLLGFKEEKGDIISVFRHKDFNAITIIENTIVYVNQEWKTEQDFDILMEDIINGPKRINSETISDRFQTSIKTLSKPS